MGLTDSSDNAISKALLPCAVIVFSIFVYKGLFWSGNKKGHNNQNSTLVPRHDSKRSPGETDATAATDLRGYKKLSDGRVTTYFNRELSHSEKELLGDCTPKRISSNSSGINSNTSSSSSSSNMKSRNGLGVTAQPPVVQQGESAWNAAGTWEERDHTKWAKDKLTSLLTGYSCVLPFDKGRSCSLTILKVSNIEGDASVTLTRGKRKYIYDFSLELNWKLSVVSNEAESGMGTDYTGSFRISDVTAEGDYEMHGSVTTPASSSSHQQQRDRGLVEKYITVAKDMRSVQGCLSGQLDKFLEEFKELK